MGKAARELGADENEGRLREPLRTQAMPRLLFLAQSIQHDLGALFAPSPRLPPVSLLPLNQCSGWLGIALASQADLRHLSRNSSSTLVPDAPRSSLFKSGGRMCFTTLRPRSRIQATYSPTLTQEWP